MSGSAEVIPMRVLSTELSAHVGEHIRLAGWVHAQRSRRLSYAVLRDRAGLVQVVLSEPLKIVPETVVEVEARQSRQRRAPSGVELREPTFRILARPRSRRPSSCAAQW
jgi:nondiscriminating aspartyl-tRNA synthetase